jgi:hypothetical protein
MGGSSPFSEQNLLKKTAKLLKSPKGGSSEILELTLIPSPSYDIRYRTYYF